MSRANGFNGEFFRRERIVAGFTVEEFAAVAGMTGARLLEIEFGQGIETHESAALGRALFKCQAYRQEQKLVALGREILAESAA